MDQTDIPSELRVAKYAGARLKEIQALSQVLSKYIHTHIMIKINISCVPP